ncbi:TerC family protein [Candidatus Acetothermia bacterium]|nr:TerC family protein [Candidatus Acetothermia bacterium]MBI3643852.1 TerC family protein [Candidatus Acetothermia bacterium]
MKWAIFGVVVVVLLVLDLGVFHRKSSEIKLRDALLWSGVWIGFALAFNLVVYFTMGEKMGINFLAGYLIERSLSIDNLFVFWVIFSYFHIPTQHQNRVLFWGIVGALIIRALFILAGIALVHRFEAIIYLFGAFLIFTGIKMAFRGESKPHPEKNPIILIVRKLVPVTTDDQTGAFFIKRNEKLYATPLFIVLITIAVTDVIFALDSVPAILAITLDPFVVYSSNVFAVLGMRALYFALASLVPLFRYLEYGLAVVLTFVGVKMALSKLIDIPVGIALSVIVVVIGASIGASILFPPKESVDSHH